MSRFNQLLSSDEFRSLIASKMAQPHSRTVLVSSFIKKDALTWLLEQTAGNEITVVARWRAGDLLSGVSDFECFDICQSSGIRFGIDASLHAKVYQSDTHTFIGSANVTNSGLALRAGHNTEFGCVIPTTLEARKKMQDFIATVTWLDENMVALMRDHIEGIPIDGDGKNASWPNHIKQLLSPPPKTYWFGDFPRVSPTEALSDRKSNSDISHALEILDVYGGNAIEAEDLKRAFLSSKAYGWLVDNMKVGDEINFGKLSHLLHNSILDDPTPYRSSIKMIVSCLFDWMSVLSEDFSVRQPNRSQLAKRLR